MVDLNGDGHPDILSGSYSRKGRPMAGLFQVLWGKEGGGFKKAEPLKGTDGKPLEIAINDEEKEVTKKICTRPTAADWDGDGDLDLVVGNFEGTFYLFRGEGGGKFAPGGEVLKVGGADLKIDGYHSDPFVVDWDGDGDLDLLSGSSQGGVQWAENGAGPGEEPSLGPFEILVAGVEGQPRTFVAGGGKEPSPSGSTRVWADDVDGDGKLDLLVGDDATVEIPAEGLDPEEVEEKLAAWQNTMDSLLKNLQGGADKDALEAAMRKYREHEGKRAEIVRRERTGFVWLYVQK